MAVAKPTMVLVVVPWPLEPHVLGLIGFGRNPNWPEMGMGSMPHGVKSIDPRVQTPQQA